MVWAQYIKKSCWIMGPGNQTKDHFSVNAECYFTTCHVVLMGTQIIIEMALNTRHEQIPPTKMKFVGLAMTQ